MMTPTWFTRKWKRPNRRTVCSGQPGGVVKMWGGMPGKVFVFYPSLSKARLITELAAELQNPYSPTGRSLSDSGLRVEQLGPLAESLSRFGNYVSDNEMIALDHVTTVLRFLYPPTEIRVADVAIFGLKITNKSTRASLMGILRNRNIVLLCGPTANPVTKLCLDKCGLSWLFQLEANKRRCVRTRATGGADLSPEGSPPFSLTADVGVFLRGPNPFNRKKKMFVLAGCYGFGTQAVAAAVCSESSVAQVLEAPVDEELQSVGIDNICWVRVWRRPSRSTRLPRASNTLSSSGSDLLFTIVHPPSPDRRGWAVHCNPWTIARTLNRLEAVLPRERKGEPYAQGPRAKTEIDEIGELWKAVCTSTTTTAKGQSFEIFIERMISDGGELRACTRNQWSISRDSEIDLLFECVSLDHLWAQAFGLVPVECKNWRDPVGAEHVYRFADKVGGIGSKIGLLAARTFSRKVLTAVNAVRLQRGIVVGLLSEKDCLAYLRQRSKAREIVRESIRRSRTF